MGGLLLGLLIFALVVFAVFYIIQNLIPEPFKKIATVIAVVFVIIVLIVFLTGGVGNVSMPHVRY